MISVIPFQKMTMNTKMIVCWICMAAGIGLFFFGVVGLFHQKELSSFVSPERASDLEFLIATPDDAHVYDAAMSLFSRQDIYLLNVSRGWGDNMPMDIKLRKEIQGSDVIRREIAGYDLTVGFMNEPVIRSGRNYWLDALSMGLVLLGLVTISLSHMIMSDKEAANSRARVVFPLEGARIMKLPVIVYSRSDRFHDFSKGLSEKVIFLETFNHIAIGEPVRMSFRLPSRNRELYVNGIVRWTGDKRTLPDCMMCVEFVNPSPDFIEEVRWELNRSV